MENIKKILSTIGVTVWDIIDEGNSYRTYFSLLADEDRNEIVKTLLPFYYAEFENDFELVIYKND